jgi:signal transduction histidine kinase
VIARFAAWYDARPVTGDACLAAALALFVVPSDLADAPVNLAFSLPLLACVPLRRRHPVPVFVAVSVICLAQLALLDHIVAGDVVALIALYTLVAAADVRLAVAGTLAGVAGAGLAALRWNPEQVSLLEVAASTVISVLLAATLGAWRRTRLAELAALEQRNRSDERARIARELHDVVGHALAVIVVQADGAAAAAARDPELAPRALETIGETAREALTQTRRALGLVRGADPGLAQLDALVARTGLPAALTVRGEPRALPPAVDATLYRVAQEALTNVVKHAGAVTRVDVALCWNGADVELRVADDGRGSDAPAGHGLAGMRERVTAHRGTLTAGRADGGFVVRAVIPL